MALKVRVNTSEARGEVETLKKNLTALGSEALENEKDFEQLERRLRKGLEAKTAKRAVDDLKSSLNLTRLETAKLQRETGDYTGALRTLTPALKLSTSSMVALGAAAAGAGLGMRKALDEFGTLDAGLIGIQKTTNATDAEMVILRENILNMAQDIPVATESLLDIAQAAGQLGVSGVDNITLFTDTVARLQLTTDLVGEEGAKSLARILNTAGEAIDGIDELGSVIVALGNNMAASESEIVAMTSEISRSVSAFEVSSEAATAYGAALRAMGARAELSGSAIGRAMVEIEKALLSGGEKFEYLQEVTGMTGDQLRDTFSRDAAEVFNAWIRGMGRMVDSGQSAITLLEKFGMTGVEQIKGLTPLIANVDQLDKAFQIANAEMENATSLMEESIKASTSFRSQMTLTWNVVDEIAASIGAGLAPAIVDVTGDFRDWVAANQDFIRQDIPNAIQGISTAVSGLSEYFGDFVRNAAVNSQAFALLKEGQITLTQFITSSTNELAALVSQFDALDSAMSFGEWNKGLQELNDKYEVIGKQIKILTGMPGSEQQLADLKAQREEIEKQIKAMKDLLTSHENYRNPADWRAMRNTIVAAFSSVEESGKKAGKIIGTAVSDGSKEAERAIKSFSDEHAKITLSDFDYQVQKLDELYDHYDKYVEDKLALEEWFSGQLKALIANRDRWIIEAQIQNIRDEEKARSDYWQWYIEKMNAEIAEEKKEYEDHQGELARISDETWQHITNNMSDTFADALYQMTQGGIGSWGDFLGTMGDMWLRQMSQLGAYDIMSGLGMASGGTGLFTGGETGTGLFGGGGDIFSSASTMYSALTGGISATAFDVTYGVLTPTLEAFGASAATSSAAASSIAGTMSTIAPYLAGLAVAIPVISSLFENDPTPAIGLDFGPAGHPEHIGSSQFNYHAWIQDLDAASQETGEAVVEYFDSLFNIIEDVTDFSVANLLTMVDGVHVELDKYDTTEDAFAALTDEIFSMISDSLVGALVGTDIAGYFDTAFFEQIQATRGYETLFEAYAELAVTVGNISDFTDQFSRQVNDFGESAEDAYQNLVTIYTALEEIETGLSGITSVSSITTLNDLTDSWNALIDTLQEANATTEQITGAQSAMAQVLGANITGLTADALATALSGGGDIQGIVESAISGAAYASIAQTIVDGYVSGINEQIGQVWVDTGGDIQAVVEAMRAIDTTGAQEEIEALQRSFGLLSAGTAEASRIVSKAINGQLTAAEQFAEWQIDNAQALALYSEMTAGSVTRQELEGSVEAFSALGLEGDQLNTVISSLADTFVDASDELARSISGIESAQGKLIGSGDTDYISQISGVLEYFRDIPTWEDIQGSQTSTKEVFDESAFKTAFLDYVTWSDFFDPDAYDYNKITAWNAEVGGGITQDDWIKALADAGLTRRDHYERYGVHEGIRPWYSYDYFDSIEEYFEQYASSLPQFLSTVNEASFYKTETSTTPGELSSSEAAINAAIETISSLPDVIVDGLVNESALSEWTTAIAGIDPAVLSDIYGSGAAEVISNLADANDDYFSGLDDGAGTVSNIIDLSDYLNKKRQLEIDLLRERGDTEAALALEREGIIEDLTERYGDQAPVLIDLQERLWELTDAAEIAADATQALADAERDRDSAARAYRSALVDEVGVLEDNRDKALSVYLGLLNDEIGEQEKLADAVRTVRDEIRDYRNDLYTGNLSPYTSDIRLDLLSRRISETEAAALGGDTDAMRELIDLSDQYLEVSKATRTDWVDYARDVALTNLRLEGVEGVAGEQLTEAERQIRELEALVEEVEGVDGDILDIDEALASWKEAQEALDNTWMMDEIAMLDALLGSSQNLESLMAAFNSAQTVVSELSPINSNDEAARLAYDVLSGQYDGNPFEGYQAAQDLVGASSMSEFYDIIGASTYNEIKNKYGFATGGSFRIGGTGGPDSYNLSNVNVSPGEIVNVHREDVMAELVSAVRMTNKKIESLVAMSQTGNDDRKKMLEIDQRNDIIGGKVRIVS